MKLALFGGTFDPPHLGHVFIAQEAVRDCRLDKILFLPNHQSPLKSNPPVASDEQRLQMLRLATDEFAWAEVSGWEISRGGTSYSWETAEHFANEFPEAELFWLMGVDQWNDLERWAKPEVLATLLTFLVFPRNGVSPSTNPKFRSIFLSTHFEVSSTQLRHAFSNGTEVAGISEKVERYIRKHSIYKSAS